jgi:hypothetical protein
MVTVTAMESERIWPTNGHGHGRMESGFDQQMVTVTARGSPDSNMKLNFCRTMIRFRPDFPFCDWRKSTLPSLSPVPGEPFLFQRGGELAFWKFSLEVTLEPSWFFAHRTSLSCCTTSTNFWVGSRVTLSWGYNRNASLGTLHGHGIWEDLVTVTAMESERIWPTNGHGHGHGIFI